MNINGTIETEYGKIKYRLFDTEAHITEYSGRDLEVFIPDKIEDKAVTVIKKKAFLSQNLVKKIYVPSSVHTIEDYAFARCRKLERVFIPYGEIKLGQDVFKECGKLKYIHNSEITDNEDDDVSFLLAKTLNELDAFFLFDLKNAGSDEWMKHLDATINMRLNKDDMEDFSKMILCGEEEVVCGEDGTIEDSNPEHYKSNRVKEKVRISFLRLLHDYKLDNDLRDRMNEYLLDHVKGCPTEETWEVVLNEHGDNRDYYDYLLNIGGINADNMEKVLNDMGDRHTEIKAYLIKTNDEKKSEDNLFSDFDL